MPNGALIFAYQSLIDYVAVAKVSAQLVKRHLGLPVCLVTDQPVQDPAFDRVITIPAPATTNQRYFSINGQRTLGPWFNNSRADAWDLTPWHRTLLIDADYFVLGKQLKPIVDSTADFVCYSSAQDLVSGQTLDPLTGHRPMSWATVCWFSRDSQPIFDMWKRVRQNWDFYNSLCAFDQPVFRNDHALTLALDTISGHVPHCYSIPFAMTNVLTDTQLLDIRPDGTVTFATPNGTARISNTDLHMIDKNICASANWLAKLENVHA